MTRFIGFIPARGGSKGVPRKNLRGLSGKPLILYTIEAARASRYISDVYVSSDDDEILAVAKDAGCHLVKRPGQYAQDTSSAVEVMLHFLNEVLDGDPSEDVQIAYLQPTSPLRTARHLDEAISAMMSLDATSTLSVTKMSKSPFKSFTIESGRLKSLFDERLSNANRNELQSTYLANGAMYIFSEAEFRRRNGFPSNGSVPYVMAETDSIDIDTESDLQLAEKIIEQRNG